MYKSEAKQTPTSTPRSTPEALLSSMADSDIITITNHLGTFEFSPAQVLQFDNGLVGFVNLERFAIANMPNADMQDFKLLQSLDVPELSFIVLPAGPEGGPLAPTDVDELSKNFKIAKENLAFLFIVTIRMVNDAVKVTMNLRAPILLDTAKKTGRQFILPNQDYSVQHELA